MGKVHSKTLQDEKGRRIGIVDRRGRQRIMYTEVRGDESNKGHEEKEGYRRR